MSSVVHGAAGPSPSTQERASQHSVGRRDLASDNNTSRPSPAPSPSSPSARLPRDASTNSLGADDEELLLQELVSITAGAAPFVPSRPPATTSTEVDTTKLSSSVQADNPISAKTLATNGTAAPAATRKLTAAPSTPSSDATPEQPAPKVPSATSTGSPKTKQPSAAKLSSREEQDILDAILAAVDGQQSSVSGDLVGLSDSAATANASAERAHAAEQHHEAEAEQDAVDRVLEEAKLLASSTVLCETQRGELVLHIHEHVALRRQLADLSKTIGTPTCVAMAEPTRPSSASGSESTSSAAAGATAAAPSASASAASKGRALAVAVGTNLGAVALFDQRWTVLGLCGSVEANVVNARGAVVSLSLSTLSASSTKDTNEEPTAVTGHAKGVFILWSLHTLAPLRIIKDESTVPLLRVLHVHRDPSRVIVLESSGAVKLFQFWKVMSKYMLRSTTVTHASAATPISDVDTLPYPSTFYLRNLHTIKEYMPGAASAWNNENGVPWLCAPPPLPSATAASAGVSRAAWSTVADKHLVAAVSNDALLVYVVESGLQGSVAGVARHTHPPSSALSNELVRFVALEQDGVAPRVLLCVSWNTEIELLMLNLQLPDADPSASSERGGGKKADPQAQSLERIALLRLTAPLLQMVPLAGCSMLLLDQNNDAQLMDASVAVMVERHHFGALEYVTFASRLCGLKYSGTVASNQSAALLLGKDHAYGISVYSWRERLSTLVARRKFVEALDLAKGFAEEVALSTVGLSSNAALRRRELHQYMERILLAYLESRLPFSSTNAAAAAKTPARAENELDGDASLLDVLQHIASYCSTVDGLDLLYGPIARLLQQRGLLSHLLYVLERTLRHGIITYMPETLTERFIDLFLDDRQLAAVEVALDVRQPLQVSKEGKVASPTKQSAGEESLTGKERAELALMCLDSGLPNLLRLAQEHQLLRLSVTIMSYRQKKYVEALDYALTEEERMDDGQLVSAEQSAPTASVAVDLVEYTLKDCALLPGADIPANEQSVTKKALLEFLLQRSEEEEGSGQYQLLRFLRRQPQHAVRVLLFALSDEGLCSPWSSDLRGFCRTQFVSSVFFILTGGTRTQPRRLDGAAGALSPAGARSSEPVNLFLMDDEVVARQPGLRMLRAGELAQREFPPYEAVHTLLSGAAIFDELFLMDGEDSTTTTTLTSMTNRSGGPSIRFGVWTDLVVQDGLYVFQRAETVEERSAVQEQLIAFMTPAFIPSQRVAAFQPDFTRLRMSRCLAALLCKEQRYTEAIQCYIDPVHNQIDTGLQHDVFAMLRAEMQRLQDLRTHSVNAAQQLSASHRFDSDVFGDATQPQSPSSDFAAAGAVGDANRAFELSRHTSSSSFAAPATAAGPVTVVSTTTIDAAIKALQRGVMSQVEALVRIDATALAQFVFDFLPSNHREVMRLLRGSSAAFLDYLDELMAQGDPTVANDLNLQNTYIELLCAHAPERVFAHLHNKGGAITYDVQLALRAVRKYRIADASIFLLEKTMMIEEAVTVMTSATRAALAAVREEVLTQCAAQGQVETVATSASNYGSGSVAPVTATAASGGGGAAAVEEGTRDSLRRTSPTSPPSTSAAAAGSTATGKATSSSSTDLLSGAHAVPAAAELLKLIEVGKDLCRKYQADRLTGGAGVVGNAASQNPEYWFRLLDVFMVPRRLLSEIVTQDEQRTTSAGSTGNRGEEEKDEEGEVDGTGMENELDIAARFSAAVLNAARAGGRDGRYAASPLLDGAGYHLARLTRPLTRRQRVSISALVAVYTQCTSDVLRAMMSSLDLSVVMDKVVRDNKDEAFRPFKPIILDMMASLSFDLEANRLCESATESDVMGLGRELYQKLNTGIVTLSDCCALCHVHLSEPPPASVTESAAPSAAAAGDGVVSASATPSAVCVYTCGHAYHTACCLHVMGPSGQSGCYVCAQQRFSSGQSSGGDAAGTAGSRRNSAALKASLSAGNAASRQAASAPVTGSSSGNGAGEKQPLTVNAARMQRRIRQTKVKIDHAEDLYPLLKSYLTWGESAPSTPAATFSSAKTATNAAVRRGGDAGNWVLAPSPRVPAAIGEVTAATASAPATTPTGSAKADEKGLDVETLTDAEILELFGSL